VSERVRPHVLYPYEVQRPLGPTGSRPTRWAGGLASIAGGATAAARPTPRPFRGSVLQRSLCSSRSCRGARLSVAYPCPSSGRNPSIQARSGPGPTSPFWARKARVNALQAIRRHPPGADGVSRHALGKRRWPAAVPLGGLRPIHGHLPCPRDPQIPVFKPILPRGHGLPCPIRAPEEAAIPVQARSAPRPAVPFLGTAGTDDPSAAQRRLEIGRAAPSPRPSASDVGHRRAALPGSRPNQ
jgi:hypothetical protein